VDFQQDPSQAELSRVLIAADASVDPHRLVKLCCERPGSDAPSVSLLVAADDPQPWPDGIAATEHLLRKAAALLHAAGIRLEDVVIADEDGREVDQLVRYGDFDALLVCAAPAQVSSPVLSLAVRLARAHGLPVLGGDHQARGHASWLRRVLDPLVHWAHPGEPSA